MRKYLFPIVLALFSSCQEYKSKYSLDAITYENQENDKYGLMQPDGSQILHESENYTSCVINGFFAVENDMGDLNLCRINDNTYSTIGVTEKINSIGVMNDGLIPVCGYNNCIKVFDKDGYLVYSLDSINGMEVSTCYSYSCAIMRVKLEDDTYVYLDKQGEVLFNKSYEWCSDFEHDYAVVNIDGDSYACINTNGENIFTFTCDDPEYIEFSPRYQKLSTRDEDEQIIIYNFDGTQVNKYPKKVTAIYALGENSFVFVNDDDEFGLMEYSGKELIWAKYEQLVPNGDYYLAIHPENDEIVKLIDENDNTLSSFDGEMIYDFHYLGYDFPNVIVRPDEEIFLLNHKGQIIGDGAKNYDIDFDDIVYAHHLLNLYYPRESVFSTVMELCGNGSGIPVGRGAFFRKDDNHCHTYDVKFINNYSDVKFFTNKKTVYVNTDKGLNYKIDWGVSFDEPIVREERNYLSRSAWLTEIRVRFTSRIFLYSREFLNLCKEELLNRGCTVLYSKNRDNIILSNDEKNLFVLQYSNTSQQEIIIVENTNYNYQKWINELNNKEK